MRNLLYILCFSLSINIAFCQGEKTNGDPKYAFYKLPGNVLLKNLDTLYICPNQSLQLAMVDKGGVIKCNVSYWKKNDVYIPNSSSNTLTIVDTGAYSANVICGSISTLPTKVIVRRRLSIYKLPENTPLSFSYNLLNLCPNDSFQLKLVDDSLSVPCNNYQWKKNGIVIPNANTNVYTITGAGSYNISLTCSSCGNVTLGNYDVVCATSINANTNSEFILFPNPASDKLFIQMDNSDPTTIFVYNSLGEIILTKKIANKIAEMDISLLADGIYWFSIHNHETITSQKIIKSDR